MTRIQILLGLLAVALASVKPSSVLAAPETKDTPDRSKSYFSVGSETLAGFYSAADGLVADELFSGKASTAEWKANLLRAWGVETFPFTAVGASWSGKPVQIRVVDVSANEFGLHWVFEDKQKTNSEGPVVLWSNAAFAPIVLKPIPVRLTGIDERITRLECQVRGLELKHHLENRSSEAGVGQVWYLEPLSKSERQRISNPLLGTNTRVAVVAPFASSEVVLVSCGYAGVSETGTAQMFRGPVLAYDRRSHRVHWRSEVDLASLRFLKAGQSYFILSAWWCDACETSGYALRDFFHHSEVRQEYLVYDTKNGISSTSSWFERKE